MLRGEVLLTASICVTSTLPRVCQDNKMVRLASTTVVRRERSDHESATSHSSRVLGVRVSMEDYYENHRGSVENDEPPSYDAFLLPAAVLERRKYNIQPREDEGREVLPPYTCAISLEAVFQRKMELEGVIHRAQDRNWNKVFVTLQGTALSFHKCKGGGPFNLPTNGVTTPDMPTGVKRGILIKSYNLQYADVGIAADYFKKRFVIRVRAEADQFLLSCHKLETFVIWLQSLFTAIDLAPPLDDRQIPRDLSIPRTRRRRPARTTQINMERNSALVAEQEEIMRRQYPQLAANRPSPDLGENRLTVDRDVHRGRTIPEDEGAEETSTSEDSEEQAPAPPTRTNSSTSSIPTPTPTPTPGPSSMTRNFTVHSLHTTTTTTPHPSIVPETGKWQPRHKWGPLYDMQYAKRCMAILNERSPRKTNFLIMKGKQWIVDWATGSITRWEPPKYEEMSDIPVGKFGEGPQIRKLRINQNGELVIV